MSEDEKKDPELSTPIKAGAVSDEDREKVVKLVDVIQDFLPENEAIVGVNCVVAVLRHDGSEDHKTCGIITRHIGGVASPEILRKVADATVRSAITLLGQAPPTEPADEAQAPDALRDLLARIPRDPSEKGS